MNEQTISMDFVPEYKGYTYEQFRDLGERFDKQEPGAKDEFETLKAQFTTPRDDVVFAGWAERMAADTGDVMTALQFLMLRAEIVDAITSGEIDPDVPVEEQLSGGDDSGEER